MLSSYGPASEHGYLELTCYVPAYNLVGQLSEAGNSSDVILMSFFKIVNLCII